MLLTPRYCHSSCIITSDDRSTQSIIIIGGETNEERISKSTEILDLKGNEWVQGPELPLGMVLASCVALPPPSNLACLVVGGWNEKEPHTSNVYGLNRKLTQWKLLGHIRTGKREHIALAFS